MESIIGLTSVRRAASAFNEMQGKLRRLNDKLFKWNGMEAWNRAMRVQATGAAARFIERHLNTPSKHSRRYLEDELGLRDGKDAYMKNGRLDTDNEAVQQAIVRWVNGAILRPNAMQRPIMASGASSAACAGRDRPAMSASPKIAAMRPRKRRFILFPRVQKKAAQAAPIHDCRTRGAGPCVASVCTCKQLQRRLSATAPVLHTPAHDQ